MKHKIRYHGQEYSRWEDLPPAAQEACRKSSQSIALNHALDKILIGGRFSSRHSTPRWIYEDILDIVDNNGRVTLPHGRRPLSKGQVTVIAAIAGAVAVVGVALIAKL